MIKTREFKTGYGAGFFLRRESVHTLLMPVLAVTFILTSPQPVGGAVNGLPECVPTNRVEAKIVRIVSSRSVETAKGLVVKLAAIEAPNSGILYKGRKNMTLVKRARKLLGRLTLNKPVILVFDAKGTDRYDRRVAHVFLSSPKKTANVWVQAEMIKQGLARTFPNTTDASCIKPLLEIENEARRRNAGLWKSRFFKVMQVDDFKNLKRAIGRLQLVEGRVLSVSVRRTRSYINFSKDWARDFTVTVSRRTQRLFEKSGMNIRELAGKKIRVRGWLDRHNGPTIKVYHVAQIEILKD